MYAYDVVCACEEVPLLSSYVRRKGFVAILLELLLLLCVTDSLTLWRCTAHGMTLLLR